MSGAVDIAAIRAQAMDPKGAKAAAKAEAKPKQTPIPRTVSFPLQIENIQTGELETYKISSTVHKDIDGMISRAALELAGHQPLSSFLEFQAERFLRIARCIVQIDNLDPTKKMESVERRLLLEEHIFDNPVVLNALAGRLAEHHARFRFGDRAADGSASREGEGAQKPPVVVVGELDPANRNSAF